ncbi:hypothetical protein [Nonomuraea sp. NEAU-A123]|uniref:hypothetical protein n=1 Tax=Nonomuraea sp. NEAU-A123 TaxID=2839649 RepID=UPI001BE3F386|nr:hypothetical protein [Nonomuraea sp. NEAU-A123]MBT2226120.1 hypothetical protein [Nonomuraea sp. NEAU-A123]
MVAVFVLLLNDHLFKQVWPGFVTGKLSDVAGLVVAPPLVALVLARRADLGAVLGTGVLFVLVKATDAGAEWASQVWSLVAGPSRVLADPTDLLASPALGLAWWARRRSISARPAALPERPRAPLRPPARLRRLSGLSGRLVAFSGRLAGLPWRLTGFGERWRVVVVVPLAVFAVAATAAESPPGEVSSVRVDGDRDSVQVDGDRIVVLVRGGGPRALTGMSSVDGGVTWSAYYGRPVRSPQTAACVPGQPQRCYHVLPERPAVAESDDGGKTWRDSWSRPEDDRSARRRDTSSMAALSALAVQARPGGHVVVVANGLDGVLVRDVAGTWRRQRWPEPLATPADDEVNIDPEERVALILAALMLFAAAGAGLRRLSGVYAVSALVGCTGLYAMLDSGSDTSMVWGIDPISLVTGFVMMLLGALVCLGLAIAGPARGVAVAVGFGAAPLVYATVYIPFYGWARGVPDSYGVAVVLAVVLTAGVVAASAALIRHATRPRMADTTVTGSSH